MGLIGDTNDIATIREQLDIFGEFMNGGEEYTASGTSCKFVTEILAAGDGLNDVITNKCLGGTELLS
ncbi:hypothetical protein D3C78_1739580 [compost metagenome]